MGGSQYWSDVRVVGGWKIQRNAVTDHHRLIDPTDVRHAWGTYEQCEQTLQRELSEQQVLPISGKVVILLHGLLRSNDSMERLKDHLSEQGGYQVINFAYASSQAPIDVHAADLKSVIDGLGDEVTEINFVAHSMGNIVVRYYLKQLEQSNEKPPVPFGRMVMLAPPNQGSEKAINLAKSTRMFEKIAGPSGLQLGVGWNQLASELATPKFEFGIMIGGKEESPAQADGRIDSDGMLGTFKSSGFQPYDLTISVDEAKLEGANDFLIGPFFHWDIKYQPLAMQQTLTFLQTGKFDHEVKENTRKIRNPRSRTR
jgi:pimeloyl-ACP methyl ester carboxylesterase